MGGPCHWRNLEQRNDVVDMLSACMIIKNEERHLGRCLSSLAGIADEIIVVDTGSTDNSLAIAESFGARIFEFPWTFDFSAARNFSLSKASKPWVLIIDADEVLDSDSAGSIPSILETDNFDALLVRVHNYLGNPDEPEVMIASSIRIFRSNMSYSYSGTVHEDVTPSIVSLGGRVKSSDIKIYHYGYLYDTAQGERRFDRNVRLLQSQLEVRPNDGVSLFYLGTEYFVVGRYQEALAHYELALHHLPAETSLRPRLARNTTECLRQTGQLQRALRFVDEALGDYPDYPDLWFLRGLIEEELNNHSAALTSFMTATKIPVAPTYETNVTATREKAFLNAASICVKQGRYVESLEFIANCLELNPRIARAYALAVQAYLSLGQLSAAEEIIQMASSLDPELEEKLRSIAVKIRNIRAIEQRARG